MAYFKKINNCICYLANQNYKKASILLHVASLLREAAPYPQNMGLRMSQLASLRRFTFN